MTNGPSAGTPIERKETGISAINPEAEIYCRKIELQGRIGGIGDEQPGCKK